MASIGEVRRILPKDFINSIYDKFSPCTADNILAAMGNKRFTTLRVNTLKTNIYSIMDFFKSENVKFERVQWFRDALIIKNKSEKDIIRYEIYKKGEVYLQSLSSMLPPIVLDPKENEKILDIAAAPGSKTTQMAASMKNTGNIIAVEIDKIRSERLKYNLQLQGVKNTTVIVKNGIKVGDTYRDSFDKVLCDVPCSKEGTFITLKSNTYSTWSRTEVTRLSAVQKKLIQSAYTALKPGGVVVYSTCTLNEEENEEVIKWAEDNLNLKVIDTGISSINQDFKTNITKYKFSNKVTRIIPDRFMEGFFICKLKKPR